MTVEHALLHARPNASQAPPEPQRRCIEVEDRTDPEIKARIDEEAMEAQLLWQWVQAERAAGNRPN